VGPAAASAVAVQVTPPVASPDIELIDRDRARAGGQIVAFDGVAEGLAWPSLAKALQGRSHGAAVHVQAGRVVRVLDVMRAVWTVRGSEVVVQTQDAAARLRAVSLGVAPAAPAPGVGCHLAVFLRPDGSLRVAAPGGPREVTGEHAAEALARALGAERASCPIRYVAFGAESDDSAWGPVFDVMLEVDRARSAGDARYVLAQAMHPDHP
jgi:hypothetical protein